MNDSDAALKVTRNTPGQPWGRRVLHVFGSLLAALVAVAFLAASTLGWFALQPDALQRALALIDGVGGVRVESVNARGSLAGPFTIERLVIRHERVTVTLVHLRGELRLASLLYGTLGVRELRIDEARVEPHPARSPSTPGFLPAWLRIAWDEVAIGKLLVGGAANETALTGLASTGSLTRWTLRSDRLTVTQEPWHTHGRLVLEAGQTGELRWQGLAEGPVIPTGANWRVAGTLQGRPFASLEGPWAFAVVTQSPRGLSAQGTLHLGAAMASHGPETRSPGGHGWRAEGAIQARDVALATFGTAGVDGLKRISGSAKARVDASSWTATELQVELGRYGRFAGSSTGTIAPTPRKVGLSGRWLVPQAGTLVLQANANWPLQGDARWSVAMHGNSVDWRRLPGIQSMGSWMPQSPTSMALTMKAHGVGLSLPDEKHGRWELDGLQLHGERSRLELEGSLAGTANWKALLLTERVQDWWPGLTGEVALFVTGEHLSRATGKIRVNVAEASIGVAGRDGELLGGRLELEARPTADGWQGELESLALRLGDVPAAVAAVKARSVASWTWRDGVAELNGLCLEPWNPDADRWMTCGDGHWNGEALRLQGTVEAPRNLQLRWQASTHPLATGGWRDWPLDGRVDGELPAIDFLPSLFEDLDRVTGKLSASITVGGTLGAPDYRGQVALTGGELDFVPANLRLRHATATLAIAPGQLQLEGNATAGDGKLAVHGELRFGEKPDVSGLRGQLQLQGERLLLVDVPEARVVASPDLQLQFSPDGVSAEGVVRIPEARLAPQDLTGVVLPSPDERVAGTQTGKDQGMPLAARVQLVMGDAVRLETMGLSGKLQGSVTTTTRSTNGATGPTTAQGELSLGSGKFKAYTRELDIERGRLLFNGGPASDPGLDLRASRQFPGVKAGVLVRGTLRRPLVRFFSEPARPQNEIASLLLVGRSIEGLQGTGGLGSGLGAGAASAKDSVLQQGGALVAAQLGQYVGLDEVQVERDANDAASLVLGKYLSPRLYVSYGVGLAEALNTLKLRYTLGRRWVLKTEAGSRQSVDLEYSTAR